MEEKQHTDPKTKRGEILLHTLLYAYAQHHGQLIQQYIDEDSDKHMSLVLFELGDGLIGTVTKTDTFWGNRRIRVETQISVQMDEEGVYRCTVTSRYPASRPMIQETNIERFRRGPWLQTLQDAMRLSFLERIEER